MKAIVCSTREQASMNLFERFLEKGFDATDLSFNGYGIYEYNDVMLVRTDEPITHADSINGLDASEIVFASPHTAASGIHAFAVHFIGNFGSADLGGLPQKLSQANANTARNIFKEIQKRMPEGFIATIECTHHGPDIDTPVCFAELGSSAAQWGNTGAASYLADCIIAGIMSNEEKPTAIAIGGNHYAAKFTALMGEYALGHICPKYNQQNLNKEMIQQMIDKTVPGPEKIFIDKNGVTGKTELLKMLSAFDLQIVQI
ncbi:MAG: hypothetical protein J4432_03415 [DPANN group archaeon]|nr:hypothetical protein [DPANN group archaeon]